MVGQVGPGDIEVAPGHGTWYLSQKMVKLRLSLTLALFELQTDPEISFLGKMI